MDLQTRFENVKIWTEETAGVASTRQLLSGSVAPQAAWSDRCTASAGGWIIIPTNPNVSSLFPPKIEVTLPSAEDRKVGRGLSALLNFALGPDEPTDDDIKQRSTYRFME